MKILLAIVGIIGITFILNGYWNLFYSLLVLFGAFLAIRSLSKLLSGFTAAISIISVLGLSMLLLIIFGIRGCTAEIVEIFAEQAEITEAFKDKTICDCVEAFENGEISINDFYINDLKGIFWNHPCSEMQYNNHRGSFDNPSLGIYFCDEDSLVVISDPSGNIKNDTLYSLKKIFECD